jgi:hypothetical protein
MFTAAAGLIASLAATVVMMAVVPGVARAQAYLPEDNLAYPVQVIVPGGGGTGFFVRRDRELFLVTARHVLFDLVTGHLQSHELTLRALSKDARETAVTVIHVNTEQLREEKQIRTDEPRDVAVVRLATMKPDGLNTTAAARSCSSPEPANCASSASPRSSCPCPKTSSRLLLRRR